MIDSPYCPLCLTHNQTLRHTYKVSGQALFRCGTCKNIIPKDEFDPEDFKWKSEPEVWEKNMKSKQINLEAIRAKAKDEGLKKQAAPSK